MTFTPEKDLANHIRFIAEYEDGSSVCLQPGVQPRARAVARSVAREWQTDGYLKPGKIKRVRRLTTEEFMSGVMGWC